MQRERLTLDARLLTASRSGTTVGTTAPLSSSLLLPILLELRGPPPTCQAVPPRPPTLHRARLLMPDRRRVRPVPLPALSTSASSSLAVHPPSVAASGSGCCTSLVCCDRVTWPVSRGGPRSIFPGHSPPTRWIHSPPSVPAGGTAPVDPFTGAQWIRITPALKGMTSSRACSVLGRPSRVIRIAGRLSSIPGDTRRPRSASPRSSNATTRSR